MKLFESGVLMVGKLPEVLDGKGLTAYPLKFNTLDDKTYEVEMSLSQVDRTILGIDHIGWVLPMIGIFDTTRIEGLKTRNFLLQKVLLAVTSFDQGKSLWTDTSSAGTLYSSMNMSYPTLKGCIKIIPLNEEEKFLCDIHGIIYK